MKHFLKLFFVFALALPFSAQAFTDVDPMSPYAGAIDYVRNQGIASGYSDGSFGPGRSLNRAEFTKIVVEAALGTPEDDRSLTGLSFTDVREGEWYVPYLRKAVQSGLIKGYDDNTYRPEATINVAEASAILARAFQGDPGSGEPWYKPSIEVLEDRSALPLGLLSVSAELQRGQMAEMIYRLHSGDRGQVSLNYEQLSGEPQYVEYSEELYNGLLGQRPFALFFHADWCPTCRAIKTYLYENMDTYPPGTFILEVDYDTEIALRQQYEITSQFTFVVLNTDRSVYFRKITNNVALVRQALDDLLP